MASPAEITQALPDVLPDDFGEWDADSSSLAVAPDLGMTQGDPEAGGQSEPSAREESSVALPANRQLFTPPPVRTILADDRRHRNEWTSAAPPETPCNPSHPKERRPAHDTASATPSRKSVEPARSARIADVIPTSPQTDGSFVHSIRSALAEARKGKASRSMWMMIGMGSACAVLVLLFLVVRLAGHRARPIAATSVQNGPAASETSSGTNIPKPSPSTPAAANPATSPAPVAETEIASEKQPADEDENVGPAPALAKMMTDQLNSPTRISRDLKKNSVESGPPAADFDAAATAGLGSGLPSVGVLPGQKQIIVNAPPIGAVRISAGVAAGLLIQKTRPLYPAIAKAAHVGGTVELQAKISKTGTIQDVHVVSGPVMLRPAALDAVRSWRYRPYKLNNEPIEVETTISVIFSFGE
jgi:TonB family protein